MKSRINRINGVLFSSLLALSAGLLAGPAGAASTYYGHGAPKSAASLPAGEFRKSLESLPSATSQRALQWLQSIEFTGHDLKSMRVDKQGGIYFADKIATGKPAGSSGAAAKHGVSAGSVLKLHSRPGATYTLFIDFDGGTLEKTAWNAQSGVTSLQASPYDTDGKPGSYSEAEVDAMVAIWQQVAEDFAPFEVDVTTQDPGKRGPHTAWVLVTGSKAGKQKMPEAWAGSVAYVNTLGSSITTYYAPALVYHDNIGSTAGVAGAVSHSTGHLAGLSHDVDGGASTAAIMGLEHGRRVTQWSKGNGRGGANPQDDIAILTGRMGLRNDDHDDSRFDRGTPLQVDASGRVNGNGAANRGIIEDRDDIDVFAFGAGAGTLDLVITPLVSAADPNGANLDIQVSLYDANGKRLLRKDVRNDASVRLKKSLPAGRYKLEVTGVGPDSGYGSLGQYVINGTVPAAGKRAALGR